MQNDILRFSTFSIHILSNSPASARCNLHFWSINRDNNYTINLKEYQRGNLDELFTNSMKTVFLLFYSRILLRKIIIKIPRKNSVHVRSVNDIRLVHTSLNVSRCFLHFMKKKKNCNIKRNKYFPSTFISNK